MPGGISCCPPGTESLQKRSRWHLSAIHLPRNSRKSVPGVIFCLPPATEFLQKRSRCHFLPSTCHGIPAKVCQVAFSAFHLPRNSRESVPGVFPCRPPATESPQKCARCLIPAVHLPRFSRKSVPGGISCCPPGTASLPMFWRQFEQNTLCCHHDGRLSCIWKMKATERKPQDESHEMEPAEWKPRNGRHRTEATGYVIPDAGYNAALRHCCAVA